MTSIKDTLIRHISFTISILLVIILLITDVIVDKWIESEFDKAMKTKANLLVTLVSEDAEKIDFDFADEFMPEFSGNIDPEYFQLWFNEQTFERSKTLDLFEITALPKQSIEVDSHQFSSIILPDGRVGKMIYIKFVPQIDSDIREEFNIDPIVFARTQKSMELAYAVSTENLNQVLWLVDVIFLIMALVVVFAIRLIVKRVVKHGLSPLYKLNTQLQEINITSESSQVELKDHPIELIPVIDGINQFISENTKLYAREKRITSDIAHELKTPITEILNLTEVAIKFPKDIAINERYKPDVLNISTRMKNIVNGILLLQKSSNMLELDKSKVDIKRLISLIINRKNNETKRIKVQGNCNSYSVYTNEVALEIILTNLVTNALFYSPIDSQVIITINGDPQQITITNKTSTNYSAEDLEHIFEPLWQKDKSRTSIEHFGLGLAIVKSFCERLGATIDVQSIGNDGIEFTLSL